MFPYVLHRRIIFPHWCVRTVAYNVCSWWLLVTAEGNKTREYPRCYSVPFLTFFLSGKPQNCPCDFFSGTNSTGKGVSNVGKGRRRGRMSRVPGAIWTRNPKWREERRGKTRRAQVVQMCVVIWSSIIEHVVCDILILWCDTKASLLGFGTLAARCNSARNRSRNTVHILCAGKKGQTSDRKQIPLKG